MRASETDNESEIVVMILKTDFETFLSEIRPTPNQQKDLQTGHQTLRERLNSDDTLK